MYSFIYNHKLFLFMIIYICVISFIISDSGICYNAALIERNNELDKIIKHDYNRTFESYNEFLVYKIENS